MKARLPAALFVFLLIDSGYLVAYPAASLFYMGNVLAHLAVGLALMIAAAWAAKRYPRESGAFLAAGLVAVVLVVKGNTLDHRAILWLHIGLGVAAAALVAWRFRRQIPLLGPACTLAVLLPISAAIWNRVHPDPDHRIVNPPSTDTVSPVTYSLVTNSRMRLATCSGVPSRSSGIRFSRLCCFTCAGIAA